MKSAFPERGRPARVEPFLVEEYRPSDVRSSHVFSESMAALLTAIIGLFFGVWINSQGFEELPLEDLPLALVEALRKLTVYGTPLLVMVAAIVTRRWSLLTGVAVYWVTLNTFTPGFIRAREQGQATACKSHLRNIGDAVDMYSAYHGGRFPGSLAALVPRYLKSIPTCPAAGADSYSNGYASASRPHAYTVVCSGHNHKRRLRYPPDYPQYTSTRGLIEP